jgi:nucleoside-diphosphate-sugar epimerase
MKNRFLITGATGFVGANIVRGLIARGEDVSVIVRENKLNWRLNDISSKINVFESDILNPQLEELMEKIRPDYIFHLAAYGVLSSQKDLNKMTEVNLRGTANLINAAKNIPFKLLINTGTFFEYGSGVNKLKESDVLNPINNYGATKAAATIYCQKEGIKNKLPIVTFRLFSPFGYFEDEKRLIPSIILSSLKNRTINISVPATVRDFVFIEDVVRAYLGSVRINFSPGEIINVGSGIQHSIKEVVNMILKLTKSRSKVEWGSTREDRFVEPKRWEADISKAKKILRWEPEYTFEQGLEMTIKWFRQNLKLYD